MKPVMYIIANRSLGMSPGKLGAQVAHAACEAMIISDQKLIDQWRSGGHYTKIVLQADGSQQLSTIREYLTERGFKTALIIDEGRTEIPAFSKTALGCAIVDKSDQHVIDTFSSFELYQELPQPQPLNVEAAYDYLAACKHLNRKGKDVQRRNQEMREKYGAAWDGL